MWRAAYKISFSDVVVDSTSVIFVSDSVDASSGRSDIVVESNYSIYFSDKCYLQAFDTTVVLAETLNKSKKYQNLSQGNQVSTNLP